MIDSEQRKLTMQEMRYPDDGQKIVNQFMYSLTSLLYIAFDV